jgi:hypothetical protein
MLPVAYVVVSALSYVALPVYGRDGVLVEMDVFEYWKIGRIMSVLLYC